MYICLCNAITEREVRHAIQLGATKLGDLQESLGLATCCGRCADCAREILLDEHGARKSGGNASDHARGGGVALAPA
jgi:bacterioferritin-associated ferredoxin